MKARYGKPEGPPLITMPRDVEATLAAWRERREARPVEPPAEPEPTRRRWWRRSRGLGHRQTVRVSELAPLACR
jgi:hypothetical protein